MKDVIKKESNPRYEAARYEMGVFDNSTGKRVFVPFPFRYDDVNAGHRHLETKHVQPETIPPFLVTLADGTVMESF